MGKRHYIGRGVALMVSIIAIFVAALMIPAYAQSVTVSTDKIPYQENEIIVISGKVSDVVEKIPLQVHIMYGEYDNVVFIAQIYPVQYAKAGQPVIREDGTWTLNVNTGGNMWSNSDQYKVKINYNNAVAETSFLYSVDNDYLPKFSWGLEGTKNIAAVATSLIVKQIKNPNSDFLQKLKKKYPNISDANLTVIRTLLIQISKDISKLKSEIVIKNPSIDPRLQFELYDYLRKPGNLVLPPEPDFEHFYDDLLKIFKALQEILFREKNSKAYERFVFVANEWITQKPYTHIIASRIAFLKRDPKINLDKERINQEIDDIDEIIESTLKYEYTRALRCYCDIVQYIMEKRSNIAPYSMKLPDFLETGAYDDKVFLLLDIGLTRNNAISISHEMKSTTIKTTGEAITWLKNNKEKVKSKLHPIMYKELERILEWI